MKITILCVGKVKEKFFLQGIDEYKKRLSKYCDIEIVETVDEKTKEGASTNECENVKNIEGKRMIAKIPQDSYVVALDIKGEMVSSEDLSEIISGNMIKGCSRFCFIIGGSLGLSKDILKIADKKISFGKITFPHQLFRLVLVEQIYRSFRIMRNEPYHK